MRRIYFLSPSLSLTNVIVSELKENFIAENHICVVGNNNLILEKSKLPKAKLTDISDFFPAMKRGGIFGAIIGILVGVVIMLLAIKNIEIEGFGILGFGVLGSAIGAWTGSMIGISVPNEAVEKFEQAIAHGEYLLMVDVPKETVKLISKIIKKHHPEVILYKSPIENPANIQKNASSSL